MGLLDYVGNRVLEEAEKNFKEYLNRNGLQKILLKCFVDEGIKIDNDIKRKIMNVKSDNIKPNMSEQEIKNNLKEVFDYINEDFQSNKKEFICSKYFLNP